MAILAKNARELALQIKCKCPCALDGYSSAGTNVEAGMEIIKNSGVDAFLTNDFTTGAKKAVELASK